MIETFSALLTAHVLADFLFQSKAMVARKRAPLPFLLHGAIVLLTAVFLTGAPVWPLAALALAHMVIDAVKLWLAPKDGLAAFLWDQAAHLFTLLALSLWLPGLWASGFWANALPPHSANALLHGSVIAAGALVVTRAGGYAVGKLMAPFSGAAADMDGLPDGGRLIGQLERGLIFVMLIAGQPAGIGFLIAAKSILRFDAASDGKKAEYVIIGTLASFGWAIAVTMAILALKDALPPLEIAPPKP